MKLFNQIDFSGGLDAEFDSVKNSGNSYPLLINGRCRDGVLGPVKKHVWDTDLPSGVYQDLTVVGDYLLVAISGELYYKNISLDSLWQKIPSWTAMNGTADIHSKVVPVTTNVYNRKGTLDSTIQEYNPQIAQTEQCLVLVNGIEQPRALFYDLSWKVLNTYDQWSMDDSEYVPLASLVQVSGYKAFYVSANKKKIYPSVSGRFLDCVINIINDGNKGGNADTTATSADFNDITAVHSVSEGGILVTTLYATYIVLPSGREHFAEPIYRPELAFPIGAVNQYSFANLVGDTAFISPGGIQSFNVARQLKNESNNFPISKKIHRYLTANQTDTCAVNYDDYALFAVNTSFGRAVAVFDTVRQQFVSLDTDFGTVKRFAVYRKAGVTKLFFINTDNRLYEAYASAENNIARVLLGDFTTLSEGLATFHKIDGVNLGFTGIAETGNIRIGYYIDQVLSDSAEFAINGNTVAPPAPTYVPFISRSNQATVSWSPVGRLGYKSSLFIEWGGDAKLIGVSLLGSVQAADNKLIGSAVEATATNIVLLGEPGIHDLVASHGTLTEVSGLTIGNRYFISGAAQLGDRLVEDGPFTAKQTFVTINGSLYDITDFEPLLTAIGDEDYSALFTLGNVTAGDEIDYTRFTELLGTTFEGPAGNLDISVLPPPWFKRHERYGVYRVGEVDFFVIHGDPAEIDGVTATSAQGLWLKYRLSISTARYKVILVHYPPYSDGTAHSYLRWPYRQWGAHLVISGHTKAYERFYVEGLPYVVCGAGGGTFDTLSTTETSVKRITDTPGYLQMAVTPFSLNLVFKDTNGAILDGTTIYA